MNGRYDEVATKYQEDFLTFVSEVDAAVIAYREGQQSVQDLYDSIVRNAAADAEFYWQMHFDSPLEDITGVDINGNGVLDAHLLN